MVYFSANKKTNKVRNNNIQLTIITLTKNDNIKFLRTLKSINSQQISSKIEWLIIDGSSKIKQEKNNILIKSFSNENKENNILINHIDTKKRKIFGIYPCMNYAKKIAAGKFIMFLNGGDQFYNNNSENLKDSLLTFPRELKDILDQKIKD